jgi:hypothetical protein
MSNDDSELTSQQRMAQVAAILARGVLRLKQAASRVPEDPDEYRVVKQLLGAARGPLVEPPQPGQRPDDRQDRR